MVTLDGQANIPAATSNSAIDSWTITFPSDTFTTVPLVFTEVQNLDDTNDGQPKQKLTSFVYRTSEDDFDVVLSGVTNTNKYTLNWWAIGDAETEVATPVGRKISQMDLYNGPLSGLQWLIGTISSPTPNTVKIPPYVLLSQFTNLVPAPTNAIDPGSIGQVAVDSNYFYWHCGVQWHRVLQTSW